MYAPSIYIADAGQAFEALALEEIKEACAYFWSHASAVIPSGTISVFKGARTHVRAGGDPKFKYRDRHVICIKTLEKVVGAYLLLKVYRLGTSMLTQESGTPIGGPLSSAILEATFMFKEHQYDMRVRNRAELVAPGRYADDIVCMLFRICWRCLGRMVGQTYGLALSFDPDRDQRVVGNCATQAYLGFVLHLSPDGLFVSMVQKDFLYAFSGDPRYQKKHAMEPFTRKFGPAGRARHRGELLGRLRRWSSVHDCRFNFALLVIADALLYLRHGYSFDHIRSIWRTIKLGPGLHECAWLALDIVRHHARGLTISFSEQLEELRLQCQAAQVAAAAAVSGHASDMGAWVRALFCLRGSPKPRVRPATELLEALCPLFEGFARAPPVQPVGPARVFGHLTLRSSAEAVGN